MAFFFIQALWSHDGSSPSWGAQAIASVHNKSMPPPPTFVHHAQGIQFMIHASRTLHRSSICKERKRQTPNPHCPPSSQLVRVWASKYLHRPLTKKPRRKKSSRNESVGICEEEIKIASGQVMIAWPQGEPPWRTQSKFKKQCEDISQLHIASRRTEMVRNHSGDQCQ